MKKRHRYLLSSVDFLRKNVVISLLGLHFLLGIVVQVVALGFDLGYQINGFFLSKVLIPTCLILCVVTISISIFRKRYWGIVYSAVYFVFNYFFYILVYLFILLPIAAILTELQKIF